MQTGVAINGVSLHQVKGIIILNNEERHLIVRVF